MIPGQTFSSDTNYPWSVVPMISVAPSVSSICNFLKASLVEARLGFFAYPRKKVRAGGPIKALTGELVDGRPLVFASVDHFDYSVVHIWDLATGAEIDKIRFGL